MTVRGMRNQDLADPLEVDESTVSRWRNGYSTPRSDLIPKIAQLMGVEVLRLMATSGHLTSEVAAQLDVQLLPVPETSTNGHVRDQAEKKLRQIPGITNRTLRAMMETYDRLAAEEQ